MNQIALDLQPASSEYRTIPLTKGQVAIVDAADFDWLTRWRWHAHWNRCTNSFYACRSTDVDGKLVRIWMAQEILMPQPGFIADHKNHDTLDNTRKNLRPATRGQNSSNSRTRRDNLSGLKGAHWDARHQVWKSAIRSNGKLKNLGVFPSAETAHAAYVKAAKDIHGEFYSSGMIPKESRP
jgi:hypothetical protein